MNARRNVFYFMPRTWIGRLIFAIVAIATLIVAALFVTIALAAGMLIAALLLARAWWLGRKIQKSRSNEEFLAAEYTVEREETTLLDARRAETKGRRDQ